MTPPSESQPRDDALTYEALEEKRFAAESRHPDDLRLRLRRSISWLGRAEKEMEAGDHDAAFIFYWIAFNAAYQKQYTLIGPPESSERENFSDYFGRLIALDSENAVYDAVWQRFSESIRVLLNNRYVFQPFWNHLNGVPGNENWEFRFAGSRRTVGRALAKQNTEIVLSILFDRLYVLRNQLMHGGATWNGSVNRAQVRDGARIMAFLVPLFLKLMLDNSAEQWGAPRYPPVDR